MQELSTILSVSNLINLIIALGVFSLRSELKHIRDTIEHAKDIGVTANKRIDEMLIARN
jgi:hypothetical protein